MLLRSQRQLPAASAGAEDATMVVALTKNAVFDENVRFSREELLDAPWDDARFSQVDPHPDLQELAESFDNHCFGGVIFKKHKGKMPVYLTWSPTLNTTLGITEVTRSRKFRIALSVPLLSKMDRSFTVTSLLHEMIHAYFYVIGEDDGGKEHGPKFLKEKKRIEELSKIKEIFVTIDLPSPIPDEEAHLWECSIKDCKDTAPFEGGKFRNGINRGPTVGRKKAEHEAVCTGTWKKVHEPKGYIPRKK